MAGDVEGFCSSIHDTSVSAGFRALYEEGLLLDVTLVIEDHQFQAHKALLATQSDYFRIMFTDKIHLKGLTATGFSHVLQFMYYGTIELSMNAVHEILQAAMYVQLIEVVKFCCSFLLAKICLENCAEIMRLLGDFGVNIEGVREKPDFLSYLSFEKLMSYLDNDHLSRFPEIELYEAVQSWLRHDRRRWRHTDTTIRNIRFCLMTPSKILNRVTSRNKWPQILIFPEGVCTNRFCLVTFKLGALLSRCPCATCPAQVPNTLDAVTWTWQGFTGFQACVLTLSQAFTRVEAEFMPVYVLSYEEK
uniref:BTB domain-containing protein n=1 Tax=Jaculus jaculus TaxID=51337 RepID=A0A8C5LH40_JACJA